MPEGTGLHAWLDDKLAMKVVSAMLTECTLSIALAVRSYKGQSRRKARQNGGLSALALQTVGVLDRLLR